MTQRNATSVNREESKQRLNELKDLLAAAVGHVADLNARLERIEREPIAVTGISCRFPGGMDSAARYWQELLARACTIGQPPDGRLNIARYLAPWPSGPGRTYTAAGSYFPVVDQFDAGFFSIGAAEAKVLDPQHRLLLQTTCHALEDAGILRSDPRMRSTGLIGSFGECNYAELTAFANDRRAIGGHEKLGATKSIGLGRIAHFLGLQGPVLEVDTSCSSSLVGLDVAAGMLRAGKADMMLVGAANLILTPSDTIGFAALRALSPTGTCAPFQSRADGYVRGEGCSVVVLSRLSTAVEAGARIYGVILGSAVNSDGRSNGLTAPNGLAQQAVIERALAAAGVDPSEVAYVETHGTGTKLGDPIEAQALARAYTRSRSRPPLQLGAVKANIGHLEAAAGLAAFVKAVLSVHHGVIPPNRLVGETSDLVEWSQLNLHLPDAPQAWPEAGPRRLAAVSGFGMSGTNAHLIVASHVEDAATVQDRDEPSEMVLPLSAKSHGSLLHLVDDYAAAIVRAPEAAAAICGGAAFYRDVGSYMMAVTGTDASALVKALRSAKTHGVRDRMAKAIVGIEARTVASTSEADAIVRALWPDRSDAHSRIDARPLVGDEADWAKACILRGDVSQRLANLILYRQVELLSPRLAISTRDTRLNAYLAGRISLVDYAAPASGELLNDELPIANAPWAIALHDDGSSTACVQIGSSANTTPSICHLAAALFNAGCPVAWKVVIPEPDKRLALAHLPAYPFEQDRYWVDHAEERSAMLDHPGAGFICGQWQVGELLLQEHLVHGVAVVPGAMLLMLVAEACGRMFGLPAVMLENIAFARPLTASTEGCVVLEAQAALEKGSIQFTLAPVDPDQDGRRLPFLIADARLGVCDTAALHATGDDVRTGTGDSFYESLQHMGFGLSGAFHRLQAWSSTTAAIDWTVAPESADSETGSSLRRSAAAALDAVFQAMASAAILFPTGQAPIDGVLLPLGIERLVIRPSSVSRIRRVRSSLEENRRIGREYVVASASAAAATDDITVCSIATMRFGWVPATAMVQVHRRLHAREEGADRVDPGIVHAMVEEALGGTVVAEHRGVPLSELGLDSIGVFSLQEAIAERFKVQAPKRADLLKSTIEALAQLLSAVSTTEADSADERDDALSRIVTTHYLEL